MALLMTKEEIADRKFNVLIDLQVSSLLLTRRLNRLFGVDSNGNYVF